MASWALASSACWPVHAFAALRASRRAPWAVRGCSALRIGWLCWRLMCFGNAGICVTFCICIIEVSREYLDVMWGVMSYHVDVIL